MPNVVVTPDPWIERAEEARELARKLKDPEAQRSMLDIAAAYDRIAARARERRSYFHEALQILEKNKNSREVG